jgi:hypothetical protein
VTATDARTLAAAMIFFGAVAAIAGLCLQRAWRLDPMVALSEE